MDSINKDSKQTPGKDYYALLGSPVGIEVQPDVSQDRLIEIYNWVRRKLFECSTDQTELRESLMSLALVWKVLGSPCARATYNTQLLEHRLSGENVEGIHVPTI